MVPKRLSVKLFIEDADPVELDALVPVFQRWIQEHNVEGMLIDVADYKHVPDGPGILLIADEGDYAVDMAQGRPGVMYTYKRIAEDNLVDAILTATRRVTSAVVVLREEESIHFNVNLQQVQIAFIDRLKYPNFVTTLDKVSEDARQLLDKWSLDGTIEFVDRDPRESFAIKLNLAAELPIEQIATPL